MNHKPETQMDNSWICSCYICDCIVISLSTTGVDPASFGFSQRSAVELCGYMVGVLVGYGEDWLWDIGRLIETCVVSWDPVSLIDIAGMIPAIV